MVGALGVDQRRLFTSVFFLGACLAGLGGALQLPRQAVNLNMDVSSVVEACVVSTRDAPAPTRTSSAMASPFTRPPPSDTTDTCAPR